MGGGRIQTELVSGGIFCEILVKGTKRGGFNVFFSGGDLLRLVYFFLMSCKNSLTILIWGHVQNINSQLSYSCYVMIDHNPNFLYPLASSKQHSILRLPSYFCHRQCKIVSIRLKAKDFLFELKRVSHSSVSYFLKFGIWLWTECVCSCIWNISLLLRTSFCSWVLQLHNTNV